MVQAKLDEIAQSGTRFTGFANLLHDMTGAAAFEKPADCIKESALFDENDKTNVAFIQCKSAEEFPGGADAAKELGLVPGQLYKYVCKDFDF